MGELLTRRALMLSGEVVKPLFSFVDRDYQIAFANNIRAYLKVTKGNHFKYYPYRRGTSYQACATPDETYVSNNRTWPVWFSLHAGDEVTMKLKNVYLNCNQGTSYNAYARCILRDTSSSNIIGWSGSGSEYDLYVVGKQTKQFAELSQTVQIAEDVDVAYLIFYNYGSTQNTMLTLECDVEIYVNGIRYV